MCSSRCQWRNRGAGQGSLANRAFQIDMELSEAAKRFLTHAGIEVPLICGAMYPCSNPELIAAVSEAGGIGIVQPISISYVYKHDFREGLRLIKRLTKKPFGFNVLTEQSSKIY